MPGVSGQVWMVRDSGNPDEDCQGDPVAVFATRDDASAFMDNALDPLSLRAEEWIIGRCPHYTWQGRLDHCLVCGQPVPAASG